MPPENTGQRDRNIDDPREGIVSRGSRERERAEPGSAELRFMVICACPLYALVSLHFIANVSFLVHDYPLQSASHCKTDYKTGWRPWRAESRN